MAVSVVVAVGDVADPLVDAIKRAAAEGQGRPGHRPGRRDGPAHHARAPRQGRRRTSTGAASRARRSSPTAARPTPERRRLLPRRLAARRRDARDGRLPRRDLRAGARRSCAPTPTTRRSQLVNDNPYGNGVAIFTRDGGAARQFQFDVEGRHGRHQRADPGAGRLLLVRRLEGVALRRLAHLRAGGRSTSTRAARSSRPAGPTRPRARSTSASRRRASNQHSPAAPARRNRHVRCLAPATATRDASFVMRARRLGGDEERSAQPGPVERVRAESGLDRVLEDVLGGVLELRVALDSLGRESSLEEMARALVTFVEPLGVDAVQPVHSG